MGRILHIRIHGLADGDRDALRERFRTLADARQWRDESPWLSDATSQDLFSMEYFRHAALEAGSSNPEAGPLSAAAFVKLEGDETDALAMLFILRDLSERFGVRAILSDAENPIAKLRNVEMVAGRLLSGAALETILVRRSIFKKLRSGFRIEMFPPHTQSATPGTDETDDVERRNWSFWVHGMRGSAPTFLEAEAEAMRIYNGLRRLE